MLLSALCQLHHACDGSCLDTRNACFGELLLCALKKGINDLGIPSSVHDTNAEFRACQLSTTSAHAWDAEEDG